MIKTEKAKAISPTAVKTVLVSGTKTTRRREKIMKVITATVTNLAMTYSCMIIGLHIRSLKIAYNQKTNV